MASNSEMNALVGAFGSMIGYLGAEAAEVSIFERLLWPQRFYNVNSLTGALVSIFLGPMGGPLHKAALETLDSFRKKGLYGGKQHGHMLDTAFYSSTKLKYKLHGYSGTDLDKEVRNGLWVNVLRRLRSYQKPNTQCEAPRSDEERASNQNIVRRTTQRVQYLKLSVPDGSTRKYKEFSEDHSSWMILQTMVASEASALLCGFGIIWLEHCYWFAAYLCVPLVLKILSIPASVKREAGPTPPKDDAQNNQENVLVEVSDYDHGFPLIEGPEFLVRAFFKHYSHPIRHHRSDRIRELVSITLVLAFVFYFPMGLLSMLFVDQYTQMIWLSYQLYIVVVLLFNRLIGYEGPGRIEDSMAQALAKGDVVRLRSGGRACVDAKLESHAVGSIGEGRERVKLIVREFQAKTKLERMDSDQSLSSMTSSEASSEKGLLR